MAKKKSAKSKTKRVAKKATARPKRAAAAPKAAAPWKRQGVITHTELASADPGATKAWCEKVLGWKFGESVPTPNGPYHMWRFANNTGGGIRSVNPQEPGGSIPYCEVSDIKAIYARSLAAGATGMFEPSPLPNGMGSIAIVGAPGGVAIGFWSAK